MRGSSSRVLLLHNLVELLIKLVSVVLPFHLQLQVLLVHVLFKLSDQVLELLPFLLKRADFLVLGFQLDAQVLLSVVLGLQLQLVGLFSESVLVLFALAIRLKHFLANAGDLPQLLLQFLPRANQVEHGRLVIFEVEFAVSV